MPCLSLLPRSTVKFLKCLPRASREQAGKKLAAILDGVVSRNDHASWEHLLLFSTRCFRHPGRGGRRWSLASAVNRQLREEADPPPSLQSRPARSLSEDDLAKHLAAQVSEKLEEGDFKGAVRLASSDDSIALVTESTYLALLERHPQPHPGSVIPPVDAEVSAIRVDCYEVRRSVRSFKRGSAGGPDGLRPQHLKDMLSTEDGCRVLLPALTSFIQLVLDGRTPPSVRAFFLERT